MSRKSSVPTRKIDRRVRRTRESLGDALVELIQEKPFAAITVQHVIDRANVGRSTFYAHYRDKDDLFLSDAEDFFEMMSNLLLRPGEVSRRVAPVAELFSHVAEWHKFHAALIASGKARDVMDLGQEYFARSIKQRLVKLQPKPVASIILDAQAHALAGAMMSLLNWWLDHGTPVPPIQMDELYHRMVWAGAGFAAVADDAGVRPKTRMPGPSGGC
jgi:AcrR family transcriptional regulator